MADKKVEWKYFTISQWEKEEKYLRKMHNAGWKLSSVTIPGRYVFEACEPEDVVYRLDYNKDAEKDFEEYHQIFEDCGWEYVLKFVGYSYFRKKASAGDETDNEIFADDASKLEMCKRVVVGRMLPLLAIFCCIIIPQMVLNYCKIQDGDAGSGVVFGLFCVLMLLYLFVFVTFGVDYFKYKKTVD